MPITHKTTIINEGIEDSIIFSSEAYSYTWIAKVLKLNGLKMRVADNSFIISIKIKIKDSNILNDIKGIWILNRIRIGFFPKTLAVWSIFFDILKKLLSIFVWDIVKKRTIYAKHRMNILPVKKAFISKLKLILKKLTKKWSKYVNGISTPIAIIEPGIAYPSEAILLKNKFIFVSLILAE